MEENRRNDQRYPLSSKITITMNDVILNKTECRNISLGGMCIAISDKIDNWKNGLLIMVHKFEEEVVFFTTKFKVLWNNDKSSNRKETLIGVNFKDIDPKNFDFLSRIIHHQSNMAS